MKRELLSNRYKPDVVALIAGVSQGAAGPELASRVAEILADPQRAAFVMLMLATVAYTTIHEYGGRDDADIDRFLLFLLDNEVA